MTMMMTKQRNLVAGSPESQISVVLFCLCVVMDHYVIPDT